MATSSKSSTKTRKSKTAKKGKPDVNTPGILGYHYLTKACTINTEDFYEGPRMTPSESDIDVEYQTRQMFHTYSRIRMKTQLLRAACSKPNPSPRVRVEFATRLYSGAHAQLDRPRALELWNSVASMPVPAGSTISSGPDKLLARHIAEANMFLCMVHLRAFQDTFAWPDLAAAFRHGEAGTRLGLLTSASYMTGSKIRKFALAQMHIAMRMPGPPPDTDLPPITSAEDRAYVEEIFSCETLVAGYAENYYDEDAEESEDEDVLACGRPGCNVTTTTPSDFKRCGGKCPMHIKPYYCSKDCQKQDWKRHKAECQRPSDSEEKQVKFTTLQGKKAEVDLSSLKNSKAEIARQITESYTFLREDKRVPGTFAAFFAEMEAAVSGNKSGQTPEEFMRMVEKWPKSWVLPHH